jgi:hypothetical protein
MYNKSLIKILVGVGIVAAVLIFLGVNYVPRIFAYSSGAGKDVVAGKQTRIDYLDEQSPRAIYIDPRSSRSIGSPLYYARSDWIERHPSSYYLSSDWIERHPSNYYLRSDWIERHPPLAKQ